MARQGVLDDMLLASHAKNGSNARVQRGQKLLLAIDHGDSAGGRSGNGVVLRRITLRMQAMSTVSAGPGDGATPPDGQHVQDDTGADMHMLDDPAWCPLGANDKHNIHAGTANMSAETEKVELIGPQAVSMGGRGTKGDEVVAARLLGPTAISTRRKYVNQYAGLLPRNGIENCGFDKEGNTSITRAERLANQKPKKTTPLNLRADRQGYWLTRFDANLRLTLLRALSLCY
jgi:hypothetical protein